MKSIASRHPLFSNSNSSSFHRPWAWPIALVFVGAALYFPGMNWGLPGTVSWSQDTIAGLRTIGPVRGWPGEWRGRYPPLHYLVLDTVYRPVMWHWEQSAGDASGTHTTAEPHDATGASKSLAPALPLPHAPKIGTLLLIARVVSALMAIGGGLGLFYAARVLTRDALAAGVATLTLMTGAGFVYYAHLGNVDAPSIFWFAWSVYFFVRALDGGDWRDCALLGLLASLAISTKDAVAGVYPGMAVVLLAVEVQHRMGGAGLAAVGSFLRATNSSPRQADDQEDVPPCEPVHPPEALSHGGPDSLATGEVEPMPPLREQHTTPFGTRRDVQGTVRNSTLWAIVRSVLQWKWLIGLVLFALPYLFLNGIFHNPEPYLARMRYWLDASGDTLHARQYRYPHQLALLWATVRYAAGAVGWPMLFAMVVGVIYTLATRIRTALVLLAPALSYYLIVIVPIGFVYERFLFAPLALMGILTGIAAADLWRAGCASSADASALDRADEAGANAGTAQKAVAQGAQRRRMTTADRALACGALMLVLTLSIGYAVGIDLEMIFDSRYRAEAWFERYVAPPSSIGAFPVDEALPLTPQYLPRLHEMGYSTYPVAMRPESFDRPQPEYLLLSSYDYGDFASHQRACMDDLLRGRLGYRPVATFTAHFLGPRPFWLTIAGYGAPTPGKISPTIHVLKRAS